MIMSENPDNRGGAREGAGRPKSSATVAAQEFREVLAAEIKKDADQWISAIKDLALGHFSQVKTKDGEVKVYKTAPDPAAWQKATDRAFGKPQESVDHTTGGKPIETLANLSEETRMKISILYETEMRSKALEK